MKEQSHKDEMSAALRGDFQRLRERGVAVSLGPTEAEPVADATSPEEEPAEQTTPLGADAPAGVPEPAPEPHETQDGPAAAQPGWLGRLLGR